MIAGTRADSLRKLITHLREDHLFDREMTFECVQAANARFEVSHVHRVIVALLDEAFGEPAGNMPKCDALLYEVAYKAWREGKSRHEIVVNLWGRASTLFCSNGTRVFVTIQECGEIADEARADYIAEQGAGGLHAETWTLAELAEFCDEYNVCISRRAEKWNAFYGSGRIVSEADWDTFITKVSERVT